MNSLTGNLGKDPELRTTTGGTDVASFSLAVKRKGQKDITDWFDVVAFGDQAKLVMNNLKKGSYVKVEGEFQKRSYNNKEGHRVDVTEFWITCFWLPPAKEKVEEPTEDIYADAPF